VNGKSYQIAQATIIRMERPCRVHGTDVVFLASVHGEAELLAHSMEADGWTLEVRESCEAWQLDPDDGEPTVM